MQQIKGGGELRYLHNELIIPNVSSADCIPHCFTQTVPDCILSSAFSVGIVKAFCGSLCLLCNDDLQIHYAREGGQCQHKVPA